MQQVATEDDHIGWYQPTKWCSDRVLSHARLQAVDAKEKAKALQKERKEKAEMLKKNKSLVLKKAQDRFSHLSTDRDEEDLTALLEPQSPINSDDKDRSVTEEEKTAQPTKNDEDTLAVSAIDISNTQDSNTASSTKDSDSQDSRTASKESSIVNDRSPNNANTVPS